MGRLIGGIVNEINVIVFSVSRLSRVENPVEEKRERLLFGKQNSDLMVN